MKICVFDTEAINLEKPFCYDIGYIIYDTEASEVVLSRSFVVEQVWHNTALFATAYYAEKRPIYVSRMRARRATMAKFGNITQQMVRDFENYNVEGAYAYNSSFDEKVFQFNCDWFKCINPFDNIPIFDIRAYVHKKIAFDTNYQKWCEMNSRFTESGQYSTTAESVFQFIADDADFVEAHTGLEDAEIECAILVHCVDILGAKWNETYKVYSSVPRRIERTLIVTNVNGETYEFPYERITIKKNIDKTEIILKKTIDKTAKV